METNQTNKKESGQVLVLILMVTGLIFAFAALAIDGSLVLSDRRGAQNAADSAALSAGYSMCQGQTRAQFLEIGRKIAAENGYTDNGGDIRVQINNPPLNGAWAGNSNYIEVVVKTNRQPVFLGMFSNTPLATTTRSVAYCNEGAASGAKLPGLGGEVAMLALNKTASNTIVNSGYGTIIVDGGVFSNSTSPTSFNQNGSSIFQMSWAKIRGGASLAGSFGMNEAGTGEIAQQIDIAGNVTSTNNGHFTSGMFNVGGNVTNGGSVRMTPDILNVGGSFNNSGAGGITADKIVVVGNITNNASGTFLTEKLAVGGNIVADGNAEFGAPPSKTLEMTVKGNINLSGSAHVLGNLTYQGSLTKSGGSYITPSPHPGTVTQPAFTVDIPEMSDPLASVLNPPIGPPAGSCANITFPQYGTFAAPTTPGGYYCSFNVGGSVVATIPPGTYWVDSFSLGGAAKLTMDGVQLFVTGKNGGTTFQHGGSATISMVGTMVYVKKGAFAINGYGGNLNWSAPTSGEYQGLALFMDRTNTSPASQSGSAFIQNESGTWYAPASKCTFTGNTNTTIYSQFICDTIEVNGSSNLTIRYNSSLIYQAPAAGSVPQVSLIE